MPKKTKKVVGEAFDFNLGFGGPTIVQTPQIGAKKPAGVNFDGPQVPKQQPAPQQPVQSSPFDHFGQQPKGKKGPKQPNKDYYDGPSDSQMPRSRPDDQAQMNSFTSLQAEPQNSQSQGGQRQVYQKKTEGYPDAGRRGQQEDFHGQDRRGQQQDFHGQDRNNGANYNDRGGRGGRGGGRGGRGGGNGQPPKDPQTLQQEKLERQASSKAEQQAKSKRLQPTVDPKMTEDILEKYNNLPPIQQEQFGYVEAMDIIWDEMTTVLHGCSLKEKTDEEISSHIFGDKLINPILPAFNFQVASDGVNFETSIARIDKMPPGQTLANLLTSRDNVIDQTMLNAVFEPPFDRLIQDAARESVKLDKRQLLESKLERVFKGLSGEEPTEISPVCLGLEQQMHISVHDPLTGLLTAINYNDKEELEEASGVRLEEETEIDDLLRAASDPLKFMPSETLSLEQAGQRFLGEFREAVSYNDEGIDLKALTKKRELLAAQKKQGLIAADDETGSLSLLDQASSDLQPSKSPSDDFKAEVAPQTLQNKADLFDSSEDELEQIVGSNPTSSLLSLKPQQSKDSDTFTFSNINETEELQAEPSHFPHAVALKRHKEQVMNATLESMEPKLNSAGDPKQSDQQWVIKDEIDMKNFDQMIGEPALKFQFELDDFQKRAIYRLEQGECVMVAAHTSAGKTAVAEYAIALSKQRMTKTIYTSPIKSLSNQKYRDFKLKFGDVGVLTGDVQLNREASCLIMTTEVLQSMLYNEASSLQDLEWVIFDEVHYITDPERGSVWEEVIMKLPDTVSIIMLSATVPNYLEFANWVGRTKQRRVFVQYTDKRPVPLAHCFMLDGKLTTIKEKEQNTDMKTLTKIISQRKDMRNRDREEKLKGKGDKKGGQEVGAKQQQVAQEAMSMDDLEQAEKRANKKIDFKGEAIKAKKDSMNKMLKKQTKSANAGGAPGGSNGPNSGAQKKAASSFNKTLNSIQKDNLLPCIVFAFSRAGTLQLAEGLDSTTDFTDGYTKGLIRKFVKQKLQRLDPCDRVIPQVKAVTELLYRGIGVHHAGLLQLLKELVEILFSDGYLKVVFATSTFAIGLNLPARCVLFTQMKKFNGTDIATISTSEYLQMAGRAGRRGKDSQGFSVICVDPDLGSIPLNQELQDLLDSKGVTLESKLKIEYQTCLNILKQDQGEIDSLLANSFFADEAMKISLQNMKMKKKLEPLYEKAKFMNCPRGCENEIDTMFNYVDQLWEKNSIVNQKLKQAPFVQQVIEVTTAKHILKQMVVIKTMSKSCLALFIEKYNQNTWPMEFNFNDSPDLSVDELRRKNQPANIVDIGKDLYGVEYCEVNHDYISKFYSNKVCPEMIKLHFQSQKTLNEKQLRTLVCNFAAIKTFQEEELRGKAKKAIQASHDEQSEIIKEMRALKCWNCELLSHHMTQKDEQEVLQHDLHQVNEKLSGGLTEKELEYNNRNQVLIHYKIIDQDLNLLFKGKVAAKAQSLLLNEFFFSGIMNDLTNCELLAVLSIFNTRERAGKQVPDCTKTYSPAFQKATEFLETETQNLLTVEEEKGVQDDQEGKTVEERLNYKFYEMVYDWADQKTFAQVIEDNPLVDDGLVVKMIMTVNRTRQKLQQMATFVGDNSLAERLKEAGEIIDRGIVKMQSLYLEVEQEPPRLNLGWIDDSQATLQTGNSAGGIPAQASLLEESKQ